VGWDEPHVSVGGMLEQSILGKFWESHRRGFLEKSTNEKQKKNKISVFQGFNAKKAESS
jgi:hypothetical protein